MGKVHRVGSVPEDLRRLPGGDRLHPSDEYLGVGAEHVHPPPVHVEIPQPDVVETVHVIEAAQQPFVEELCGAVDGSVRVGMVRLDGWKCLSESVDRSGRRRDHLADLGADRRLQHVECAVDEDILRQARIVGAVCDPNGRLMKYDADALHGAGHGVGIADAALDDSYPPGGARLAQVLAAPAREIVEDDNLGRTGAQQLVGDMGSDQPGSTGDEYPIQRHASLSIFRSTRAGLPATIVAGGTLRVTTLPAPTIAFSPISMPHRIVAPEPIVAPRRTIVGTIVQSPSPCSSPRSFTARGKRSLMNITPCPTKTWSSISTPSQMKVWLDTLTRRPTFAPFWISTNVPMRDSSPISQPYRLTNW